MLQHDKRKLRISGTKAAAMASSSASRYSPGWHPQTQQMVQRDNFHGPEVHPSLGPHAAKAYPGSDQVILFMDDGKGSGVPVLGRRVPMGYKLRPETSGNELLRGPAPQPAVVVGRRSHRLYHPQAHQHQHQHHHQQQQQQPHLMIKSHQHHKSKCAMIMNDEPALVGGAREQYRAPEPSQQALSGRQISHLNKTRPRLHQSRSSANIPAEAYHHQLAMDSGQLNNWPPQPVRQQQHARRRQVASSHQSSAAAGGLLAVNLMAASSSCSSLCSADECQSCCSPPEHQAQQASCREPCCMLSNNNNNYAISQCRRACCQPREPLAKPKPTSAHKLATRPMRQSLTLESPDYLHLAYEAPPQRQARSRMAHQGGAAQRARSSHELCQHQHRRLMEQQQQHEQQPMRISGRNMLPIKRRVPVYVGPEDTDKCHQVDNSVSQIYESLAAELKAKLGDPRHAPILLPPKDYDTLNRRHGRLADGESRRRLHVVEKTVDPVNAKKLSSNKDEQLKSSSSGRTDRGNELRLATSAGGQAKEDKLLMMIKSSKECDSARSSGRLDGSPVCRSRSNSSSGLGSISMGAGSRNSSPSSSSDDMHRMSGCVQLSMASNVNNSNGNNNRNKNKNYGRSPDDDNCGEGRFSDSASQASESGGHTDTPGGTLLRADSDYHERHELVASSPHPPNTGANTNQHLPSARTANTLDGLKSRLVGKGYDGTLRWKGRVEIPLKVNSDKNGNTYLATKQIIY